MDEEARLAVKFVGKMALLDTIFTIMTMGGLHYEVWLLVGVGGVGMIVTSAIASSIYFRLE